MTKPRLRDAGTRHQVQTAFLSLIGNVNRLLRVAEAVRDSLEVFNGQLNSDNDGQSNDLPSSESEVSE
jgi:hypothetical protein